jgi:hypothetical protein
MISNLLHDSLLLGFGAQKKLKIEKFKIDSGKPQSCKRLSPAF